MRGRPRRRFVATEAGALAYHRPARSRSVPYGTVSDLTRTTGEAPVRTVRITWTTAVLGVATVIGLLVARGAFVAAHRVLGWTAAAIVAAVFVSPIVTWLGRWIPRVLAVILTFLVIGAVIGGLVFGTVDDLDSEVSRLQRVMPSAIEDLEERDDEIGRIAREIDLSSRAETFLEELDNRVGSGSGALAENAPTVPVYFVSAILAIFVLVYGPAIARGGLSQISDAERRETIGAVLAEAMHRARQTVSALLGQGAFVGLLTYGVAALLDLPAPIVLGLLAAVIAILPDVGIMLGTFPTVALTAALDSVTTAAVLFFCAFLLQSVEALYLRRKIRDFGVDLGPAVVWIVALVGYTIYGPGMAFYGVIYVIFALAVLDQAPALRAAAAS